MRLVLVFLALLTAVLSTPGGQAGNSGDVGWLLADVLFSLEAVAGSSNSSVPALNDADSFTAWTSARIGDTLVFKFPSDLSRELNGRASTESILPTDAFIRRGSFRYFGRIKTIRLFHNDRALFLIHLAHTRRRQHVTFPNVRLNVGDTLAIEVLDTYPGERERTAAISEIVVQGAH
jgi:hypothetical protein